MLYVTTTETEIWENTLYCCIETKIDDRKITNHQAKRKGDAYGRGIALPSGTLEGTADIELAAIDGTTVCTQQSRVHATKCCCGATDHVWINFGGCELNPKNIA